MVHEANTVDPRQAAHYRAQGWWGDDSLADHVDRLAVEHPDAVAFISGDHRLTWQGYRQASERLAETFVAIGSAPGERVAVLLPDTPTVHVALGGAERAGVTAVGIGARAGTREIAHILRRSGAVVLVTLAHHRDREALELVAELRAAGIALRHHVVVPRFEVDVDAELLVDDHPVPASAAAGDHDLSPRRLGPDDVYLINSTSGTTGLPKCVLHTQNRWVYFHHMAVEVGELGPDEVVLAAVPTPFGFGQWTSHVTPTLLGAPCVLVERFSADEVLALIERHRVTVLAAVSTQFIMMLASPELAHRDLSSLRVLYTGGEAVPFEQAAAFEERTGAQVLQFYGSNESGLVTGTRTTDTRAQRLRTAGRVLDGTELRLMDGDDDVTATGRGQPASRGPATSLGYLDDPAANDELYTSDGWVRHADICTVDDEGYLTVVGRTSDIIIRGGKNISAPQVEEEVGAHPSVELAAAVAVPDPVFGERVCVFVQLRPGTFLTVDELGAFLTERGASPEMKPERLVIVDELPRSSGGKVAKGELRQRAARLGTGRT